MKTERQTSMYLLLAIITSVFSALLNMVTVIMSWELWIVPLVAAGCFCVWFLHIGRIGSPGLYENLCSGLLLLEFFFFSVHETSLFDIPAMAGILVFSLFMLNKKWILHVTVSLYALALLYHGLILRTISLSMERLEILRLAIGAVIGIGGTSRSRDWRKRRKAQ